ncbi:MAG: pseudouridine synthase [bacterium]
MEIRLNKYLAENGVSSRRGADQLILSGKITINGSVTQVLGTKIDPESDEICVDGQIVARQAKMLYYALNKPIGVVSTASDPKHRSKVTDFVPREPRVYPVGRLDNDSDGLILLTNDGELTNQLTHPSFEHSKEYLVVVSTSKKSQKLPASEIKALFENGLQIEGKLMKADKFSDFKGMGNNMTFKLILHTGYNRQIRKMCAKIGFEVVKLTRIRIGKLKLVDLSIAPGEYREINKAQIL